MGKWAWGEGKDWYGQRWAKRSVGQQSLALEGLKPEKGLAGDRKSNLFWQGYLSFMRAAR